MKCVSRPRRSQHRRDLLRCEAHPTTSAGVCDVNSANPLLTPEICDVDRPPGLFTSQTQSPADRLAPLMTADGPAWEAGPSAVCEGLTYARLAVFLPVTVEAMTTKTAATTMATIQRTQSIPSVVSPPKAV